ncbi:MAG: Lipopolysaccharide biosynthesis protein rfbH [candidate division TM6 bacterium GW2011_GWF2_37_49]|nr:MAG: Lipopolysaccharide biosynthesis protein rfbH [candidate division TM6 bacterium GW2011_GWF2_37_49]
MESSVSNELTAQELELQILELVKLHHLAVKKESLKSDNYKIHYAGRCYDENEVVAAVKNLLKFTLTYGKQGLAFERELARFVGVPNSFVVNSGSSANLVAISSLCSNQLCDEALSYGDEVIVPAASFPTTVAPIIQNGLIPVFVDSMLGFYNPSIESIKRAYSPKTRAVVFAHTLGNPAQIDQIKNFCIEKNLFLIEDCCDALGSKFGEARLGTFGDLATFSFYPAHHITMGEGGAVAVSNPKFAKIVDSLRSWGKDCWCVPGETHCQGACRRRFGMKFGELPLGYDHKYVYTNIGYNLKPLDLQCAIGLEQLKKLSMFIEKRKYNFNFLYDFFKNYQDLFILPQSLPLADPCWFAFPLTIKSSAGFTRLELTKYFEENNIETRVLFAGNIIRQPAFMNIKCRISERLDNSDKIMHDSFFIGVYPGLTQNCLDRITKTFKDFLNQKISKKIFLKKLGDSCEAE